MQYRDVAKGDYFLISTPQGLRLLCRDPAGVALQTTKDGEKIRPNSSDLVPMKDSDLVLPVIIGESVDSDLCMVPPG